MEPTPPQPSTSLLSAQEAKDRLREIVEGFFFRRLKGEDGKRIRRLLIKSPPRPLLSPPHLRQTSLTPQVRPP